MTDSKLVMKTTSLKDIKSSILSREITEDDLQSRLKPILRQASEICGSEISLINVIGETGYNTVMSVGDDDTMISCANKIAATTDRKSGLNVLEDPAEHPQIQSRLTKPEKDRIKFYAGLPLENETGQAVGFLCVCDSGPKNLSDSQLEHLKTLADGARTLLQLYYQSERLNDQESRLNRYSMLLKNSADVTFILDVDSGQVENVNHDVERILGYSAEELRGTAFQDYLADSEPMKETTPDHWFRSEEKKNGRYKKQLKFIDGNDSEVILQCNFTSKNGSIYVSAIDISDQKEAETRVVELKDKFKKVVKVATDLIYELDWQSGDLSWGNELSAVLGYPNSDRFVDYDWWLDKIHPEDLDRVINDVSESVEGEAEKINLVYRIRTYEGTYKYVMNRNYVQRTEDGTPRNIIGAIVDISDLVKSEKQSDQNKMLLEKLADNAWSATWIRDDSGTFLFSNEKYKDLFDLNDVKVTGSTLEDIFENDKANEIREKDKDVLESGDPQVFIETAGKGDELRNYKVNLFPLIGIPGLENIVGGIATDITSEKENRRKLEESLAEKETMLKEIHHRVKNNLAVVSGMMHLQAFKETDERVQQKLFDSTGRIKTMATIHELLYKSASFTNLSISENIERLIDNITDTYHISIDLDVSYEMDPVKLNINDAIPCSLIVNEVVTNVLKHAFDDGDSGTLDVLLSEDSDTVTLRIRDNGKGLPDDFEKEGDGSSLGMELIRTLTSQLEGEYSYTSLNQGVEFKLVFNKSNGKGTGSNI